MDHSWSFVHLCSRRRGFLNQKHHHLWIPEIGVPWDCFAYHGCFGCSLSYTESSQGFLDVELVLVEEIGFLLQMQTWRLQLHLMQKVEISWIGHHLLLHTKVKWHWQNLWQHDGLHGSVLMAFTFFISHFVYVLFWVALWYTSIMHLHDGSMHASAPHENI